MIRDPGTPSAAFDVPDELWSDEKRRPSWAVAAPFGGKGDHDGDGRLGGSLPGGLRRSPTQDDGVVVSADWRNGSAADRRALASRISGHDVKRAPEADSIIEAYVEANKPEPFGDAPEPQTIVEAQKEAGGIQPDWAAPSGGPKPVDD